MRNNHSTDQQQITTMKIGIIFLLVAACTAYTPIRERSWLKFVKVKQPTYNTVPIHEVPNIIQATHIDIEERIDILATMVRKSVREFQDHIKKYTAEVTKRVKRATQRKKDYGFVRKPELRHQYGMLFNHHGQVISGLKNMGLIPINRLAESGRYTACAATIPRLQSLGVSTSNEPESTCVLLSTQIWKEQPWTNDRTEYEYERVFSRGHTHYSM